MSSGRALPGASSRGNDAVGGEADAELSALAEQADGCTACRISDVRRAVVFGRGRASSRVVFVVDQPAYHDEATGTAISSEPGRSLFLDVVAAMGLSESDVYVACAVKCRPRAGRSPFPDEAEACEGYLFQQIRLVSPDMICPLGNLGYRLVTGKPGTITTLRGTTTTLSVGGKQILVAPIYHPAAASTSTALTNRLLSDARDLGRLLRSSSASSEHAEQLAQSSQAAALSLAPTDHHAMQEQLSFALDSDPDTAGSE
jgi:DNA polymerase